MLTLSTSRDNVSGTIKACQNDDEEDEDDEGEWISYSCEQYIESNLNSQKLIVLSDIGLSVRQDKATTYVNTFNVQTNKPLQGATIKLISTNNQVIDSALSDINGLVKLNHKSSQPLYIIAQYGNDINYLDFKTPQGFFDGLDTTGVTLTNNTNTFLYTDRGIINPGEDIHINTIIRNQNLSKAPIKLSIINPRGDKIIKDKTINPIGFGLYSYKFETDTNFATGSYQAIVNIGGVLYRQNFQVENIIPNKIKVNIDSAPYIQQQDKQLDFTLNSIYLSGVKADSLKYVATITARALSFSSKIYKDFSFNNASRNDYGFSKQFSGNLDKEGNAHLSLNLDELDSQNLNLSINAKVFENTGHPVINQTNVKFYAAPNVIGVKVPSRYIDMQKPFTLPVILLNSLEDKPIANTKLHYKIYKNDRYWWWDYDVMMENFNAKIKSDISTTLIKEGEITSALQPVEIKEDLSALVQDYDSVFVEISDGVQSPRIIWLVADFYGEASLKASNPSRLALTLDKPKYNVGENALLQFQSKHQGKALITLSYGDKILKTDLIDASKTTTYQIPILPSYAPNIHASVTLLSLDPSTATSKRSFGLISIPIVDSALDLKPEIQVQEQVKPNSMLHIKISNPKKQKMAYTLAIVDNGILDIINFKTPDPLAGLYKKLAFGISIVDNYSNFISEVLGIVHQSVLIGGSEGESYQSSQALGKKRKENLSYFVSGVSGEQGEEVISYQLPNYVGSVRVMLVVANDTSVGSAESNVIISDKANLYSNLASELKIDDKVIMPLEVVAQEGVTLQKVNFKFDGDLAIKTLDSTYNQNRTQMMQFLEVKPKQLGESKLTITMNAKTSQGEVSQTQTYTLNITSPNTSITDEELFELTKHDKRTLQAKQAYIPGSQIQSLNVSPTPLLPKYQDKVQYLLGYMYGCIEQSSSATMPLILGFEGVKLESSEQIRQKAQKSINRILNFQKSNGGFGYWIDSKMSHDFGSEYATLFLLTAKQKGFEIPDYALKSWEKYALNRTNNANLKSEFKTNALFLLALNGTPNIAVMNEIYRKNFKELPLRQKLALSAAYKLSGLDSIAKEIRAKVADELTHTNQNTYADIGGDYYYYGSSITHKAMSAYFLNIIDEKPDLALIKELSQTMSEKRWMGTQDIATTLLALSSLKESSKEVRFSLNDKDYTISKPTRFMLADSNKTKNIITAKDNTIYVSFMTQGIPESDPLSLKEITNNLQIKRRFFEINANGKEMPINPENLPLSKTFYVEITLQNTSSNPIKNIALTQIIPTGWEIENTRIKQSNNDENDEDEEGTNNSTIANDPALSYMDIKRDRVIFFFDDWIEPLRNGDSSSTRKVYIKFNTTLKGEYILSGAYAEAMYNHNFEARTKAIKVKVKD
ncbi:MG2 domain-containing protein [uncultured Helicobacter sp.]|uniref:alpha-2-macroglobulin family protein n=1 Tax=uncultured Helicobacter sp. TaxID=175537 RepID=UPI00258E7816|nr:MG2 domain-containing protein [uncultured Helicobacter sp.]